MDALKAILPRPIYTLAVLAMFLFWIGYEANDVVANVKKHYTETSKLVSISRATCVGVRTLAKLDTKPCHMEPEE
jgi:hypothetical protein